MCRKFKSLYKAHIGRKSNGNTIIQGSELRNPVFLNNTADFVRTLGDIRQYESVEKFAIDTLSAASRVHPLYPDFSAKPDSSMQRLVSTPETEDALQKYPRSIKGTCQLDYSKYPYMDKSETPWEYAYRTQTKVELQTTAYQEYLGNIVDPFPIIRYADGMITTIVPPAFPPAVDATIVSGEVNIPIKIRRKPCMEYGKMLFGTENPNQGFNFDLIAYKGLSKTDVKIKKVTGCALKVQLLREKLINEIRNTKNFSVYIGESALVTATFTDDNLSAEMFIVAPRMVEYLENLVTIETYTGCHFDLSIGDVTLDDFRTAYILASSLNGKWHCIKMNYDDDIRCEYKNIPEDITADAEDTFDKVIEGKVLSIALQGQRFSADQYIILYRGAQIDNIAEIARKRKHRKKNIPMVFRPAFGKEFFYKYCKFEGVHLVQ